MPQRVLMPKLGASLLVKEMNKTLWDESLALVLAPPLAAGQVCFSSFNWGWGGIGLNNLYQSLTVSDLLRFYKGSVHTKQLNMRSPL